MAPSRKFVLTLSCPDPQGMVSMASSRPWQDCCDSIGAQQFGGAGAKPCYQVLERDKTPVCN
jgi:hypothetical protein